ncbi:MAG: hypothetical protein AABZ08_02680 [Planctomycetota bacterium]
MKTCQVTKWWMIASLASMAVGFHTNTTRAQSGGPADGQPGVEVLTRGPVHEAFAETITFNPEPGIVVPNAPRDIIEEVPPDQRPDGANVTWIPGYWAWDDDRNDFLWVSGVWRALPPGRQWMPGYWGQTSQGYQWTSGYWADALVNETEYLPEPPESIEVGPNIAAPSPDFVWVPGCWIRYHGRYAWRPGYWEVGRADWDWIPAHYVCAPRGYVFSAGYWDYPVERRGVIFAPVYFETSVYTRRDFHYSPSFVINLAVFSDQLFVRPHYHHYYFGDYYDNRYRDTGFFASFSYHSSSYGYDPIYSHRRWVHRQDRDWDRRDRDDFTHRRDVVDARPPRTLLAQRERGTRVSRPGEIRIEVAASFDVLAKRKDGPIKFKTVDATERLQLAQRGREVQKSREDRRKVDGDATGLSRENASKQSEPVKLKLPKSSIVGRPVNELTEDQAPPKTREAPQPDPKIEPTQRKSGGKTETTRGEKTPRKEDQRPEQPKARIGESKPASPPKTEPQKPAVKPKSEPTKQEPKSEPAKATKKPPADPPKPAPKPNPKPPKPEPRPDPPKAEPKEKPKAESKDKPKSESKEKPKGESKEKPKEKP